MLFVLFRSVLIENGYEISDIDGDPHVLLSVSEYSKKLQDMIDDCTSSESEYNTDDENIVTIENVVVNSCDVEEEEW